MKRWLPSTIPGALLAVSLLLARPAEADDRLFDVVELSIRGRVVTAEFADFNGDGRTDLLLATLDGIPPAESRQLHIYLQAANGKFSAAPTFDINIPPSSAVYDIADLKSEPGEELVVLQPDGVTILSLASPKGPRWRLPVTGPSTVAAANDERGFERLRMVYSEFVGDPWLLVPQIGMVSILTTDGSTIAQIEVGRRANYYVAKDSGLLSVESDLQLYLDVPKISVGDVDGDGSVDVVAATRHEIRTFLMNPAGRFSNKPERIQSIGLISQRDHTRGSGTLVTTARDIDADGRLDLVITHVEGSFGDAVTTTYVIRNRNGSWDIMEPDERFVSKGTLSSDRLMDIDGDELLELVRVQLRFSVLEIVELLLTREFDARLSIHHLNEEGRYTEEPWSSKKVSTAINFDTFRPRGFMPTLGPDINADGVADFITSTDGKGIAVFLGDENGVYSRRSGRQKLSTTGVIRFADFSGDGLPDFVLFDTQSYDAPVRIGQNTGELQRSR